MEGEVAVTEFSDELGAALVLHIHASPDPEVEVSRRLAVAAMAHEKATGRVVRAILVTLEAP